jgi:excisionase family DNA binding protein
MNDATLEPCFTTAEAAAALRLSIRHLYRLVKSKEIVALRSGRKYLIPRSAVAAYIERKTYGVGA